MKYPDPKEWQSKFPDKIKWCRHFDSTLFTDEVVDKWAWQCPHFKNKLCRFDEQPCYVTIFIPVKKVQDLNKLDKLNPEKKGLINIET